MVGILLCPWLEVRNPEALSAPADPGVFQGWRPFPIIGETGSSAWDTTPKGTGALVWLLLLLRVQGDT